MKIGIIRCDETSERCAGWNCFPAIRDKSKYMDEYDTIELIGFDTCGGCPGRTRMDKIVERGLKLKEKGAEDILVVGGGIIPEEDKSPLVEMGLKAVFGPGTSTQEISDKVEALVGTS